MESSICSSVPMLLFLSLVCLLPLNGNATSRGPSPKLFNIACHGDKLCEEVLESEPKLASASNIKQLVRGTLEVGASNASNTQAYIQNMVKAQNVQPGLKEAMLTCNASYHDIVFSFSGSISSLEEGDYDTPTYDLKVACTDRMDECTKALDSTKLSDPIISDGNKFVIIFYAAADAGFSYLSKTTPHHEE